MRDWCASPGAANPRSSERRSRSPPAPPASTLTACLHRRAGFERDWRCGLFRTGQFLRRGNPNWIFTDGDIASSPVTKSSIRHRRTGREASIVQQQKPIAQPVTRPHKRSAEIALIWCNSASRQLLFGKPGAAALLVRAGDDHWSARIRQDKFGSFGSGRPLASSSMSGSFDVAHQYIKISTRRSLLLPLRGCFIREIRTNGDAVHRKNCTCGHERSHRSESTYHSWRIGRELEFSHCLGASINSTRQIQRPSASCGAGTAPSKLFGQSRTEPRDHNAGSRD